MKKYKLWLHIEEIIDVGKEDEKAFEMSLSQVGVYRSLKTAYKAYENMKLFGEYAQFVYEDAHKRYQKNNKQISTKSTGENQ